MEFLLKKSQISATRAVPAFLQHFLRMSNLKLLEPDAHIIHCLLLTGDCITNQNNGGESSGTAQGSGQIGQAGQSSSGPNGLNQQQSSLQSGSGNGSSSGAGGSGSGDGGEGQGNQQLPDYPGSTMGSKLTPEDEQLLLSLNILPCSAEQRLAISKVQQGSLLWRVHRLVRVTASEVPRLLLPGKYDALVEEKIRVWRVFGQTAELVDSSTLQSVDVQQRMAYGRIHEPIAVQAYTAAYRERINAVHDAGFYIHPEHPYIGASPDRLLYRADGAAGVLEVKCYSKLPDALPESVKLQVMTQLACQPETANWQFADVFFWTSAGSKLFTVEWDAAAKLYWQEHMLPKLGYAFFKVLGPAALTALDISARALTSPLTTYVCTATSLHAGEDSASSGHAPRH